MTETVPNPQTAVSASAPHSAAWIDAEPSTMRLSGAQTSSRHHGSGHHNHHRHVPVNHHEPSAAPRYQQSIHVDGEHEAMDNVNSSSSSRTNSSYRIHNSSTNESTSRLPNVGGAAQFALSAKRWTQFEDSEEYASGSDDDSNEDTDDGHTVDDYDDESDKPHMSSDTETRNLLEDADVGEDDDDEAESCSSDESEDLTESVDLVDSGTLTAPKKVSVHSAYSQHVSSAGPYVNDALYEMSADQRQYYERCFLMLQHATQGKASLSGAVNGADDRVVEFFKKSYLDSEQLSRIWMLSDVNEDGWLNLEEFSIAMHLVVLHVKGRNPIPNELPARVRPPVTPVRGIVSQQQVPTHTASSNGTRATVWNSTAGDADASGITPRSATILTSGKQNWKQFDFDKTDCAAVSKGYSLSDEQLHLQDLPATTSSPNKAPVAQFSDVPPILVDSRPTPLRSSQPLSGTSSSISVPVSEGASQLSGIRFPLSPQNGPKGPPPKPPPRPTNRGHGRSASLDLNSMAFTTTGNPMSSSTSAASNQLHSPPGTGGYPRIPAKDRGATLPASLQLSSMVSRSPLPPPVAPPPRRIVPHTPAPTPVLVDATSQTDVESDRIQEIIAFNLEIDDRLEKLSVPEAESTDWKERCEMMRRLNMELEAERAKLAQIRLQLELRLQEVEQGRGPSKPTSL
uniref:EF-hand domain-containing protein n=1 Tax=Steinernema glaseri TaxID=37863 RepID=A0A1I7ZZB0_9BILA